MTHIYFIEAVGMDRVKIGTAQDLVQRICDLQVGCPVELRLLGAISGTQPEEKRIHRALRGARRRGEWFDSKRAIEFLDDCCTSDLAQALTKAEAEQLDYERACAELAAINTPKIRAAVREAVQYALEQFGAEAVCEAMQCSMRCVEKAKAGKSVPELHRLFGLTDLDPELLDGVLAVVGLRLEPIEEADKVRAVA